MATTSNSRPPSSSALPPIPGSPTYSYASTSQPMPSITVAPPPQPPHSVLTKADLEASQTAYSDLLSSAKAYRLALAAISSSASSFGSALEACARLKEARSPSIASSESMSNSFTVHRGQVGGSSCTADSLLAASGVHQLIANHQQILSETVYRSFEVPLLSELDQWRRRMEDEEERYQKEAKVMSREIRRMEKEGARLQSKRKRDVGALREYLVRLTGQLDGLTGLHGAHARGLLQEGQEMSVGIVECTAGLVRAEVDIFEALARKGWSGGGLDELLERGRDLFANDTDIETNHANNHSKIFSILPQKSILPESSGQDGGMGPPLSGQARSDSLHVEGTPYQSLAGAVSARDADVTSIFSEGGTTWNVSSTGVLNRSRGVRPFSPPPMERVTDCDPLDLPRPGVDSDEPPENSDDALTPRTAVAHDEGPQDEGNMEPEQCVAHHSVEQSPSTTGGKLGDGSQEMVVEEQRINVDDNTMGIGTSSSQRRWSVTDDGAVSD
ncbi:Uncharacterized protein BP5553_00966 [Venustampulla echinocandica]|uniref:Protein IVY1 n=1 Tax=Venustampulla echinocandica TaxID=2656787 RepID=A0A370TZM9_9HELO|nr:Uncharacterized protein BP5553_00966 [Venustampulla echinocandica]RDL40987.1 Uncharacterized protein BP5553_00966 [Venustampulla echinocandica]